MFRVNNDLVFVDRDPIRADLDGLWLRRRALAHNNSRV